MKQAGPVDLTALSFDELFSDSPAVILVNEDGQGSLRHSRELLPPWPRFPLCLLIQCFYAH